MPNWKPKVNENLKKILERTMSREAKNKLKPCPFCGEMPKIRYDGYYVVGCDHSGNKKCKMLAVNTWHNFKTELGAIKAWNRRAS